MEGKHPQIKQSEMAAIQFSSVRRRSQSPGIISSGPLNYPISYINLFHTFLRNDRSSRTAR